MEIIHFHFEELVSTNDWAKEQINTFDQKRLTVITADKQIRARGQYGRTWISPEKCNLTASFCFFLKGSDGIAMTHLMALSLIKMLEKRGVHARIKWPNDLLVEGKKIAGILGETIPLSGQIAIIVGVGLNINVDQEVLKTIDQPATSLLLETGKRMDIQEILRELEEQFATSLETYQKEGFAPFETSFHHYLLPRK
ncbi:MAG: Bifunctional ligase/repressor BirA [Chlamydiae bacterium]|nr:Bifunctional ligase/repressor BirA [Chlamydiota bacterium]